MYRKNTMGKPFQPVCVSGSLMIKIVSHIIIVQLGIRYDSFSLVSVEENSVVTGMLSV